MNETPLVQKIAEVFRTYSAASRVDRYIDILSRVSGLVITILLLILAVRAMLRVELHGDSFWYHIPFAAIRGGLEVPHESTEYIRHIFEGFPPLPHFIQGILWRLTGSINATNVINYLAFLLFLGFCGKKLKAPIWLVATIALTSPMVLIQTTVSYIDLFANSWLAIGVSSLLYGYYYEKAGDRGLLLWGMMGLIGAAWSKMQLVPIVGVLFILFFLFYVSNGILEARQRRTALGIVLFATVVAALPYVKNMIYYHNPFWPIEIPFMTEYFPYTYDVQEMRAIFRPQSLMGASQFELFFLSLFEINNPTSYPNRSRWIIDQGNTGLAFTMGGFWGASVVVCLLTATGMGLIKNWRKGVIIGFALVAFLCFIAVLPMSHYLRYFLFLPLTWAALIGMLFNDVRRRFSHLAFGTTCLFLGMFLYVSYINRGYYEIERIDYQTAADSWNASRWWGRMQPGTTYCAIGMEPIGFLLTGPTMTEFTIIDRQDERLCPQGAVILKKPFVTWQLSKQEFLGYALQEVRKHPTVPN